MIQKIRKCDICDKQLKEGESFKHIVIDGAGFFICPSCCREIKYYLSNRELTLKGKREVTNEK